MGYTKFEIELALFEIFRDFTWREVDVIEEYNFPEITAEAEEEDTDEFVVDFGADINYTPDPESPRNQELMNELKKVATDHGLKIFLDLPNNDLICDIAPNLVDIEVSKDWNGTWRIQPNFSMRVPSNELIPA